MRTAGAFLAFVATAAPTTALACSCGYPEEMTPAQLRTMMNRLSVIGYGRIAAIAYPAACRIAPLRWINSAMGRRAPVTYRIAFRKIVWGRSARTVDVVQYQQVDWSRCRPLGDAACEPSLPAGDALWPLRRSEEGSLAYAGRCGVMLATYVLRLQSSPTAVDFR